MKHLSLRIDGGGEEEFISIREHASALEAERATIVNVTVQRDPRVDWKEEKAMSIESEGTHLTGQIRFRPHIRGFFIRRTLLILQVEVEFTDGPPDANGMPRWLAGKVWRDAGMEDLTDECFGLVPSPGLERKES